MAIFLLDKELKSVSSQRAGVINRLPPCPASRCLKSLPGAQILDTYTKQNQYQQKQNSYKKSISASAKNVDFKIVCFVFCGNVTLDRRGHWTWGRWCCLQQSEE